MLKKISLPILLTVMCILLLVVLFNGFNTGKFTFLQKKAGNQTAVLTKEEEKITRTDYTEVARKTLDWIDKQRNEKGWYILGKVCGQKDCEVVWDDAEVGNKDGLIATWARLNFYEQHKEAKDLEIVKKDIDLFYEKYKNDDLKDSLWLCKTSYEMTQSKYLDQGQKDKLKELCFNTKDLGVEDLKNYWSGRFQREIKVKFPPPVKWDFYSLNERYFDSFFGNITDLIYKYRWSGDKKQLNLIDEYFTEVENLVLNEKRMESQNKCLFGISILDIYKHVDKSKARLDYAINFYKILENDETKNYVINPICGLFVRELFELTKDITYLEKLKYNNVFFVKNNEREERGQLKDGFVRSDLSKGGFRPDRNVVENSLIIELIR